jgi:regulator of sirC expression with transglutaminase-like and TPR domain
VLEVRRALEAIGTLPDEEIDIADAALQLARIDAPEADWQAARTHLSALAREAVEHAAALPEDDLPSRIGVLARLIGGRHDYRGDDETYDDPANANLIRVTERRRGLPVAIGIIWLHCAHAAAWRARGLDFPGHFLLALEANSTQAVLDVFAGGMPLDARDLRGLIKEFEGPTAELRPGLLRAMQKRDVLLRLQNNLKLRRLNAGQFEAALVCVEDMLRIAPDAAGQWRDAGLLNQRLDRVAAALRCFERFVELVPAGDSAQRTRAVIEELRTRLN